jgi:hypothetical protein
MAKEMFGSTATVNKRGKTIEYKDAESGSTVSVDMSKEEWA